MAYASNGNGNARRRVVITGLGMVSPLGNDVESSWQALLAGECGAGDITQFDHDVSTSLPSGVTAPRPVITTRLRPFMLITCLARRRRAAPHR